jgi:hypothetical protein
MAAMAYEHEIFEAVEPVLENPAIPARSVATEGVDVRLLCDVDLFLGDT